MVFAHNSRRKLSVEKAKEISKAISEWKIQNKKQNFEFSSSIVNDKNWLQVHANKLRDSIENCRPLLVGVFSDNDVDEVNEIAKSVPLDLIQLSGHEGLQLAKDMVKPTVKAIHVGDDTSANEIRNMLSEIQNLSGILLDTKDAKMTGGTGRAFDWKIAKDLADMSTPFFLAGGLDPSNIYEAVTTVKPFAVDVSSGVETNAKKDVEKIKNFVINAKKL